MTYDIYVHIVNLVIFEGNHIVSMLFVFSFGITSTNLGGTIMIVFLTKDIRKINTLGETNVASIGFRELTAESLRRKPP